MPETILTCIKQMLGLTEDYTPYDREFVMHINSVLMILDQLGVGRSGFRITLTQLPPGENETEGKYVSTETWNDFFGSGYTGDKEGAKSYIFMKVKLMFDPSASSVLMESYRKLTDEFEFRLNVASGV